MIGLIVLGGPTVQSQRALSPSQLGDLLKLVFVVTGGVGAAVGLVVAYRRQRVAEAAQLLAERAALVGEQDGVERRDADLYAQSLAQLGNQKPVVRLGGLYGLERLAQSNVAYRQVVVNIVCAYLRMPFTPPLNDKVEKRDETDLVKVREELRVRLAAQNLLARHLRVVRPKSEEGVAGEVIGRILRSASFERDEVDLISDAENEARYWPAVHLDLANAVLVELDFRGAKLASANFGGAKFYGLTMFQSAQFEQDCSFVYVRFMQNAHFDDVKFGGNAYFSNATFSRHGAFSRSSFHGSAEFVEVEFNKGASFQEAVFGATAQFDGAVFDGNARFLDAEFKGRALFSVNAYFYESGGVEDKGPKFHGMANFHRAIFRSFGRFTFASFDRVPVFTDAKVFESKESGFSTWPDGWAAERDPEAPDALVLKRTQEPFEVDPYAR